MDHWSCEVHSVGGTCLGPRLSQITSPGTLKLGFPEAATCPAYHEGLSQGLDEINKEKVLCTSDHSNS